MASLTFPRRRALRLALWPLLLLNAAGCFKTQDTEITGAGEPLFTLTGRVSDIDNNRPLRDALVEIKALNLKSQVDSNGVYSFSGLKVGTRTLQVSAANYATAQIAVTFQYEDRDVVQDVALTKALGIAWRGDVPFANPSGIWWENNQLFMTNYDTKGGFMYRLDENLRVLQVSPHLGTLFHDTCFYRIRTCFWKDSICYERIDPIDPFRPDSITLDSVFVDCSQRLYGVVRIGDHIYTSDGIGAFWTLEFPPPDPFKSVRAPRFFRLDPQSLEVLDVRAVRDTLDIEVLSLITDLAWDGQVLWLTNMFKNSLPKFRFDSLTALAVYPSPASKPVGAAWDGKYLWISAANRLLQLHHDARIRNRYILPGEALDQIAWDGTNMWAINTSFKQILKLTIPLKDHL